MAGAGLLPMLDGAATVDLLRFARGQGVITSLDPVVRPGIAELILPCLPYLDVFLPNSDESALITGLTEPADQLQFYRDRGARIVGIKQGPFGCLVSDGQSTCRLGVYDVPVKDTCGAGDAFVAGFLYGVAQGWALDCCARFATATAAFCVQAIGTTTAIPPAAQVVEFMTRTEEGKPAMKIYLDTANTDDIRKGYRCSLPADRRWPQTIRRRLEEVPTGVCAGRQKGAHMPLVNDYQQVKDVYREAAELGVGLPVFCAEDRETLEAILASALAFGQQIGVEDLPIIPAWTVRYPGRGQMTLVSASGNPRLGVRLMFSDLAAFMSEDSPYRKLRVLPHLDHGFPWLDGDIMEEYAGDFASIMCDASERPFEENIRLTAEYVERMRGRVVVEGAVDEIFESGGSGHKNEPTTVAQAQRFLRETGVDILVPNVGTEHRATADQVNYRADRARADQRRRRADPLPARDVFGQTGRPEPAAGRRVCENQRVHHVGRAWGPGSGARGLGQPARHPRRSAGARSHPGRHAGRLGLPRSGPARRPTPTGDCDQPAAARRLVRRGQNPLPGLPDRFQLSGLWAVTRPAKEDNRM